MMFFEPLGQMLAVIGAFTGVFGAIFNCIRDNGCKLAGFMVWMLSGGCLLLAFVGVKFGLWGIESSINAMILMYVVYLITSIAGFAGCYYKKKEGL